MGELKVKRGGRRKRYYEMTGKGEAALVDARTRSKATFAGLGRLKPVGA
jgi:DNA-binding PadR family transcriptional regulator